MYSAVYSMCVCVCVCVRARARALVFGPGSSVGIATDYALAGLGSNPGEDEIFRPFQTGPGANPVSCKMDTGSFPVVKCGRSLLLTTHPF